MKGRLEDGRWVVELRRGGIGRWITAGFLSFWLAGWAMGEIAGVGLLLGAAGIGGGIEVGWLPKIESAGAPSVAALFALVWVALWTLGGLLALRELLVQVAGVDRIEFDGSGVRRVTRIGPFARARWFPREELRRVAWRRGGTLVLETRSGVATLTRLGTDQERDDLRAEIERTLALGRGSEGTPELPPDWESEVAPDGAVVLRRSHPARALHAFVMWMLALLLSGGAAYGLREAILAGDYSGRWVVPGLFGPFAGLSVAIALWLSIGREELRLQPGRAELRCRFGTKQWTRSFVPPHLHLIHDFDREGDDRYALVLYGAEGKKTLDSAVDEPLVLLHLGRWMAKRLNGRFELPAHLKDKSDAA